jgi:sec-independent protein translocase protein TatA
MRIGGLGPGELLIILLIILILFGVGRVGKIGGELGNAIRQFREGLSGGKEEKKDDEKKGDEKKDTPA